MARTPDARPGREVAGRIAHYWTSRTGLNQTELGKAAGLTRHAVRRMFDGDATIALDTIYAIEGALRLPPGLFDAVINGDADTIRNMSDADPGLIRFVLQTMGEPVEKANPRKRATGSA